MKLLLLGTSGCHLCEIAEQIMIDCFATKPDVQVELIDIAEHEEWQQVYATLIPVLCHVNEEGTTQALHWPFTDDQVIHFLESFKHD